MKTKNFIDHKIWKYIYLFLLCAFVIFYAISIYDLVQFKDKSEDGDLRNIQFLSSYYNIVFSSIILISSLFNHKYCFRIAYIFSCFLINHIIWKLF